MLQEEVAELGLRTSSSTTGLFPNLVGELAYLSFCRLNTLQPDTVWRFLQADI